MPFHRLPKGLGTITKLKQNLRNPYRARKRVGDVLDAKTGKCRSVYRTVGYYPTRKDALEALMLDRGVSTTGDIITFRQVYEMWSKEKYPTLTPSSLHNYINSYKAFEKLWDRPFTALRVGDYETAILDRPPTRKQMCRVLLSQLYKYAIRNEITDKNYSSFCDFHIEKAKPEKHPFTVQEVEELWRNRGDLWTDLILVGIYSGFRPAELLSLDRTKITDGCFVGGVKTENGRNRLVPIHPCILSIVEEYAQKSADFCVTGLFVEDGGKTITHDKYKIKFKKIAPNHTPHETRHTFATYARRSGMDAIMIKRILGHSLNDLTEEVYTHVDADLLKAEMKKYVVK